MIAEYTVELLQAGGHTVWYPHYRGTRSLVAAFLDSTLNVVSPKLGHEDTHEDYNMAIY